MDRLTIYSLLIKSWSESLISGLWNLQSVSLDQLLLLFITRKLVIKRMYCLEKERVRVQMVNRGIYRLVIFSDEVKESVIYF